MNFLNKVKDKIEGKTRDVTKKGVEFRNDDLSIKGLQNRKIKKKIK